MNEQSLVTRVNRLERENRRMKLAGVLLLLGIAAVIVMGQAKPRKVAKVIQAEKFVLIDKEFGTPNATLETTESGTRGLFLYGPGGKKIIAEMSTSNGFGPEVKLYGSQEKRLLVSLSAATGGGNLDLSDPGTNSTIRLGQNYLIDRDPKGKLREGIGLVLYDKKNPRVALHLFSDGAFQVLFDKDGKIIWSAP